MVAAVGPDPYRDHCYDHHGDHRKNSIIYNSSDNTNNDISAAMTATQRVDTLPKPLPLGRMFNALMAVTLIATLSGMISAGTLRLPCVAVVLAVSFRLIIEWLSSAQANNGCQT